MVKEKIQKQPPSPKSNDERKNKVEVQKGKIDPNPMTLRHMTHSQRLVDRNEEVRMLRRGQTLDLHMPKT